MKKLKIPKRKDVITPEGRYVGHIFLEEMRLEEMSNSPQEKEKVEKEFLALQAETLKKYLDGQTVSIKQAFFGTAFGGTIVKPPQTLLIDTVFTSSPVDDCLVLISPFKDSFDTLFSLRVTRETIIMVGS